MRGKALATGAGAPLLKELETLRLANNQANGHIGAVADKCTATAKPSVGQQGHSKGMARQRAEPQRQRKRAVQSLSQSHLPLQIVCIKNPGMTSDDAIAGPGRRIIEQALALRDEDHPLCEPEVYQDEPQSTRTDAAVEGFQGFLATFTAHVSAPKRFITEAYAAVWVIHPGAFDGMRGQDVAKLIGVPRETFSRSVAGWAAKTGIRPEVATRAFKAHRKAKGA